MGQRLDFEAREFQLGQSARLESLEVGQSTRISSLVKINSRSLQFYSTWFFPKILVWWVRWAAQTSIVAYDSSLGAQPFSSIWRGGWNPKQPTKSGCEIIQLAYEIIPLQFDRISPHSKKTQLNVLCIPPNFTGILQTQETQKPNKLLVCFSISVFLSMSRSTQSAMEDTIAEPNTIVTPATIIRQFFVDIFFVSWLWELNPLK